MDRADIGALVAEGAGTFLFFVVGAGSVVIAAIGGGDPAAGLTGIAFAHGLVLAVLVSSLGAVSGGHFNPAVTFGVWVAGRIPTVLAIGYVIAQLIGAVLAGLALRVVFDPATDPTHLGTPVLGATVSVGVGTFVEAILTMVLLAAVFGTAIDPRAPKIGGLAIGLAVAADVFMGGPLTGASMNPARWFGPAVVSGFLDNWYVYWIGPAIGAAIVALAYRFLFLPLAEPDRTPASPAA
jgi:aquaporin Z